MSLQSVIAKIAKHLATQRGRAVIASQPAQCRYRTGGGMMCAIGSLIPEELYFPDLEGNGVLTMFSTYNLSLRNPTWLDNVSDDGPGRHRIEVAKYLMSLLPEYTADEVTSYFSAFQQYHDHRQQGYWARHSPGHTYLGDLTTCVGQPQEVLEALIVLHLTERADAITVRIQDE